MPSKATSSVLIVSGTEKGASTISEALTPGLFSPATVAGSGSEARRLLISRRFDLVIINSPLPDEIGLELAIYVSDKTYSGVILIVRGENFDTLSGRAEDYGILTLAKPLSRQLLYQSLKLAVATRARLRLLEKENRKLRSKIEEIHVVNRAKWALIEYLKMSEDQAHHYIEKQAMDLRITMLAVAENILKTYES
jgi:response regulator NasT